MKKYWLGLKGEVHVPTGPEQGHYEVACRVLPADLVSSLNTGDTAADYMAVYRAMFGRGYIRVIERGMRVDLAARDSADRERIMEGLAPEQRRHIRDLQRAEKLVFLNAQNVEETRQGASLADNYSIIKDHVSAENISESTK